MQVMWHNERGEAVSEHTLMVPKDGEVDSLCAELRKKLELEAGAEERIRVMEVHQSRIHHVSTDRADVAVLSEPHPAQYPCPCLATLLQSPTRTVRWHMV